MPYYHISLDINNITDTFYPRTPSLIHHMENEDENRICLSKSISGCLSAVPWGGISFEDISAEFYDLNDKYLHLVFRVYEFDEKDIDPSNFINTEDLLKRGLVMDACNTDEVWVQNQSLKPIRSYIAVIHDYNEYVGDLFTPEYYLLNDNDEIDDIEEYMTGRCSTIIGDLNYETFNNKEDIPYHIDWQEWENVLAGQNMACYL